MSQKIRPCLSVSFQLTRPMQRHSTPATNALSARTSRKNLFDSRIFKVSSNERTGNFTPAMISKSAIVFFRLALLLLAISILIGSPRDSRFIRPSGMCSFAL